jgi:hypothetical protein
MPALQRALVGGPNAPFNYMSYSEDVSKFAFITGGTATAIPRVFSNGATIAVGTKQRVPDIPGGEAGTGFTCTGIAPDPDSTDLWIGNFGSSRGGAGTVLTPTSIVRVSANGSTLVSQVTCPQGAGGIQGVAFVTASSLRCLAYVDGSTPFVFFVNRDGTIPRSSLPLSFVPNALTWDDARQALWVGDANSGDVWQIALSGLLLGFADFNFIGTPLDHLCVDTTRGSAGYLWSASGANGAMGVVVAWDIAKDQIVNRFLLDSAQAIEGILISGTTLKTVSDGYFHSTGGAPNTSAPYNVNEFQTYTIPAVTQWRHTRVYKSGELIGPYGRQPYHLLLDRGDGDTSSDFVSITRDPDASLNGQVANVAWTGKSQDPSVTANMTLRLLSGVASNFTFGSAYVRRSVSATFASSVNTTQLGTRGTFSPDRIVSVVGSALAVNLGASAVPYRPRVGA